MLKSKKYAVKFLNFQVRRSDVWFDRFSYADVRLFFETVIKLNAENLEELSHQEMNFIYYLLEAGYIEDPEKDENAYAASYRLTLKGYEYSQTNWLERHPQYTGIILGTGASFIFAVIKTVLDKFVFKI